MFAFLSRLVLFLIALSVLRNVIAFLQRMWFDLTSGPRQSAPQQAQPRQASGTTQLQQDPVCGTYVSTETSLKRIVDGKVLHFCSNDCRDRYRA